MTRLIDADNFKEFTCGNCDGCCETFCGEECSKCKRDERCEFIKRLDEQPTVDVSELKEIFEIVMPVVRDYYEKVLPIVNEQFLQQFAELQEKATAKKPIYDESYDGLCPNCKNMAFRDVWWYENDKPVNYSHCHFCGQKIDWTEDEEVNKNETI